MALLLVAGVLVGCDSPRGDFAVGGNEARRDETVISSTPPNDGALEARLRRIYAQVDGLGKVEVNVQDGVVRLGGSTESASAEERAVGIARRIEGVVYVKNDIAQPRSPWGPLAPVARTLERLARAAIALIPEIIVALIVLAPFGLLSMLLRRWKQPLRRLGMSSLTGSLVRTALRLVLLLAGILVVLDVLGIMGVVGAVVGTLGILGIVAGFFFKDWLSIYLPGLMLGLHPPFKAGDRVRIGGYEGRVARISPSATLIVTPDAEEVRIPNTQFFREPFINFSKHRVRRLRLHVALGLDADLAAVEALGRQVLLAVRGVVAEPPPFMRVQALAQLEVVAEFFAWVDQDEGNFLNVESRARRALMGALLEHDVPLSEATILIRSQEGEAGAPQRPSPAKRAAASTARPTVDEADEADAADAALLDREFEQVREADTERDLLKEGRRPGAPA